MRKKVKRIIFDVIGAVCILIGLVGFALPLLPGFVFIIIGIYIFSLHSEWVRTRMYLWRDKNPKVKHFFEQAELKLKTVFRV